MHLVIDFGAIENLSGNWLNQFFSIKMLGSFATARAISCALKPALWSSLYSEKSY